jgi:segregation and condensation protein A
MREAADWLAARPQLGQRVFAHGQGMPTPPRPQAELLVAFLEATLAMLEGREGQTTEAPPPYRPALPDLWRIPGALRRLAELLQQHPTGLPLERCLPPIPRHAPDRPLRVRAALASTFVAGLEMERDGVLLMKQPGPFFSITLSLLAPEPHETRRRRPDGL